MKTSNRNGSIRLAMAGAAALTLMFAATASANAAPQTGKVSPPVSSYMVERPDPALKKPDTAQGARQQAESPKDSKNQ